MDLKQAKKLDRLDQFIEEHEVTDPHPMGRERFDALVELMARGTPPSEGTSRAAPYADYRGTRTRKDTSEDASG
jgi:hypothetical protein